MSFDEIFGHRTPGPLDGLAKAFGEAAKREKAMFKKSERLLPEGQQSTSTHVLYTELEGDKMNLTDLAHQCYNDNRAWFPDKANDLQHHTLGLAGEAGEVANWVKKISRGDISLEDEGVRREIGEEVIDVIIYAMSICAILGIDPDTMYTLKRTKNIIRFGKNGHRDDK